MAQVLDSLKKTWSRYPVLKLDNYEHSEKDSLKTFIDNLINKYNKNHKHVTLTKKNNQPVSYPNSKRSFIDMWGLCRNYYPEVEFKEFIQTCLELVKEQKIFGNWFCHTINRYVFSDTKPPYDSHNLREDKLRLDGTFRIKDLISELGYDYDDFKYIKPEPKKETIVLKRRRSAVVWDQFESAIGIKYSTMSWGGLNTSEQND